MGRSTRQQLAGALALALTVSSTSWAGPDEQKRSDNYDELYVKYLAAARELPRVVPAPASSSIGWMAGLSLDPRARQLNDLVTVRVVENIVGVGSADSALDKSSSGSAAISKYFGLEELLDNQLDPTDLVDISSDTKFKGGGTTTRSGELSAVMTARVVEVLPTGDLVLEGVREIDINGDRQIVVLSGVVRQADINRNNVVLSTQIGQLSIRYFGRGLIKDNLKPGWLIRLLNKIF